MLRHRSALLLSTLTALLLALLAAPPASAQQTGSGGHARGTLIVLTALYAPADDAVAEKLASTITSSLDVMMKLSGGLTVRRADFLAPTEAFARARGYYTEVDASGAVYGAVTPTSSGGYRIELGLWNGSKPDATPELFRRTISNVLTSFTMADRLALAVTSSIVGRTLREGTLRIENATLLPKYAVYADGHLLARNRAALPVLAGKREIVIAKPGGPLGDVPVEVFHVTIRGGQTTTVKLSTTVAGAAGGTKLALARPAQPLMGQKTPRPKKPAAAHAAAASAATSGSTAAIKRIVVHGSSALIRVAAAGRLYLDGKPDGTVFPGRPRLLTGIAPGRHRFEVRYSDGHRDTSEADLSATPPEYTVNFSYQPARYGRAGLFRAASISFDNKHFGLRNPNQYSAALNALSALPTVTPAMQSEIANAKALVGPWRSQRFFHLLWLGTFWAGIGFSAFGGTSTTAVNTTTTLIEAGTTFASVLFLILNAEHRGATRGGLASDMRSITGSFNRQVGGGGPVGLLVAGAKSPGELFIDGAAKGSIAPGHSLTVYGIPLGSHVVTMRYPNGHLESDRVTLSKSSRSPAIYFGYSISG